MDRRLVIPQTDDRIFQPVSYSNQRRIYMDQIFDGCYVQQVAGYERERLLERTHGGRLAIGGVITEEDIAEVINDFATKRVAFMRKVAGKPTLCGLGSARTITEAGRKIVRAIARAAVARNLGIATGDWFDGWMGAYKYEWLTEKKNWDAGWAYSVAYPLDGQEVRKDDPTVPEWYLTLREDARTPPYVAFTARTPDLMFGTLNCGNLYGDPGDGTIEEFGTSRLERQKRHDNLTVYSDRDSDDAVPADIILDTPRRKNPKCWTWDWLLHNEAAMLENGTINERDTQGIHVLRVGDPADYDVPETPIDVRWFTNEAELAEFVVGRAWQTYEAFMAQISVEVTPEPMSASA